MDLDILYSNVININFHYIQYIQYIKIRAFTVHIDMSMNKMT
jgi:hypothetical protein